MISIYNSVVSLLDNSTITSDGSNFKLVEQDRSFDFWTSIVGQALAAVISGFILYLIIDKVFKRNTIVEQMRWEHQKDILQTEANRISEIIEKENLYGGYPWHEMLENSINAEGLVTEATNTRTIKQHLTVNGKFRPVFDNLKKSEQSILSRKRAVPNSTLLSEIDNFSETMQLTLELVERITGLHDRWATARSSGDKTELHKIEYEIESSSMEFYDLIWNLIESIKTLNSVAKDCYRDPFGNLNDD